MSHSKENVDAAIAFARTVHGAPSVLVIIAEVERLRAAASAVLVEARKARLAAQLGGGHRVDVAPFKALADALGEQLDVSEFVCGCPAEVRPAVRRFAVAMEAELRANDHKGGWADDPPGWLLGALREEVVELAEAIEGFIETDEHERPAEVVAAVRSEAADVGNIAMMIADVCGALGQEGATS